MSVAVAWGYELPPDDPARRAIWVLPLAVALVLLAMLGLGRVLRVAAQRVPPPPPPVQAEIYELPAVKGPVPAPKVRQQAPASAATPAAHAARPRPEAPRRVRVMLPAAAAPETKVHGSAVPKAASRAAPETAASPPGIDWSRLGQQVDSAVASTVRESEFQRVRDPKSLVARYYLASVLRKLERVGEMSYLGTMVGEVTVLIVIGPDGALDNLLVWRSSGNPRLDDYAQRIVRMSAPFAPFSGSLERQTMQLKLTVNMMFEGYREVEAQ